MGNGLTAGLVAHLRSARRKRERRMAEDGRMVKALIRAERTVRDIGHALDQEAPKRRRPVRAQSTRSAAMRRSWRKRKRDGKKAPATAVAQ